MSFKKQFSYAYGLGIQSYLPLPELPAWDGPSQVAIRLDDKVYTEAEVSNRRGWLKLGREEAELYLKRIGLFRLRDGREVSIHPEPGTRESLLRLAVLGPVLAGLLFQRGRLVLHASAVEIGGEAVAFLGESGYGKSSLAAALAVRGHGIASDDVTPVALDEERACIHPGLPRLKISLEVAAMLGIDGSALVVLDPQIDERGWGCVHGISTQPLSLRRVYVLDDGDRPEILPVSARDAMIELVRLSYPTCTRHPGDVVHFQQCARLARQVAFFRLQRRDDLNSLSELADLVEADLDRSEGLK